MTNSTKNELLKLFTDLQTAGTDLTFALLKVWNDPQPPQGVAWEELRSAALSCAAAALGAGSRFVAVIQTLKPSISHKAKND